jgi:signal transduction histidine kinase
VSDATPAAAPARARHSLARVFARQWTIFTLGLAALFVAASVLLLFILEDSFIDRRLHEVAPTIADAQRPPPLPAGMSVSRVAQLPSDLQARTQAMAGRTAEFRRADGRYVHVLRGTDATGEAFLLVYDVTDQLTVNAALARVAPHVLLLVGLIAVLSYLLARGVVRRTARRADALLGLVAAGASPADLRQAAAAEPLHELAELTARLADAWEARLAALQQERETLGFLAHELRTPLQSARTSLALLQSGSSAAPARLQRAIDRLQRAGNSVLWLASDADAGACSTTIGPLIDALVLEFAPLAASRAQSLRCAADEGLQWTGPSEVLEAVLANLVLNAIQHGGSGEVQVAASSAAITVRNRRDPSRSTGGFGLGLRLVGRLCERCGWQLQRLDHGDVVEHVVLQRTTVEPLSSR